MKCPKDGAILGPLDYEAGIMVESCPECAGVWLDKGKLEMIEELAEHDYVDELSRMPDLIAGAYERARQLSGADDMPCPACGASTELAEYGYCSQVVINRCPQCGGVWLDRGELQALEVFYDRSRMEGRGVAGLRLGFLLSLLRSQQG